MQASSRPAVMTEAVLQGLVIREARAKGWAVHVHGQGSRTKQARPSQVNGNNGYPDLTLARDGEVLFLELKAENGKLSSEQAGWQLSLPNMEVIRPSDLARGRVDELLA